MISQILILRLFAMTMLFVAMETSQCPDCSLGTILSTSAFNRNLCESDLAVIATIGVYNEDSRLINLDIHKKWERKTPNSKLIQDENPSENIMLEMTMAKNCMSKLEIGETYLILGNRKSTDRRILQTDSCQKVFSTSANIFKKEEKKVMLYLGPKFSGTCRSQQLNRPYAGRAAVGRNISIQNDNQIQ